MTKPEDQSPVSAALAYARAHGWPRFVARTVGGLQRQLRDKLLAQRLGAPGFQAGSSPRLLGSSHVVLGQDFHARDRLWLEAVLHYAGQQFQPKLSIGPHARLSDDVHIACLNEITIGAHLLSGSRVLISDHAHGRYDSHPEASDPATPPALRPLYSPGSVVIGSNVWLGDGVAVLAGASIGDGCIIGANAVVTGQIPAATIAVGAPARPIRRWDAEARAWVALSGQPRPA